MASKGQKFNKYSSDLKSEVIKEIQTGRDSFSLEREYGIPAKTIRNWKYKLNHPELNTGKKRGRQKESEINYKERYEILKKYRAFLKAQRERK